MKLGMTSIYVKNVNEAFRFYTETLDFVEKLHMPEAELAIVVSPEDPNGTTLLLEPNGNPISKTYQEAIYKAELPEIVMFVADVQAEYARLSKLGVRFKQLPTKTEWGTQAVFDDTCGNFIQLHQSP